MKVGSNNHMKESNMIKITFSAIILILILGTVAQYQMKNDIKDNEVKAVKNDALISKLSSDLTNAAEVNYVLKNDIYGISKDVADLWTSIQTNESRTMIEEWDRTNSNFHVCSKKLEKIDIFRDFMNPKDSKPFNHLVLIFQKGYQVYYNNGTINCYPKDDLTLYPEPIECEDLCITKETKA